jgi:DNA repair protein RadC
MYIDHLSRKEFEECMRRIMDRFDGLEKHISKPKVELRTVDGEKLMDNTDLCLFLHLSKRTLQSYRTKGWLPYKQIAQKIYYSEADVKELMKNRMQNMRRKRKIDNIENNRTMPTTGNA